MVKPKDIAGEALNWELVEQARSMPPVERLLDGARLFELACALSVAGIRTQMPGADESAILAELRRRVSLDSERP